MIFLQSLYDFWQGVAVISSVLLLLYLVHDGSIFEANTAQVEFAIVHWRVDFWPSILWHVKLALLRCSHVLCISLKLLDRDVAFLDCIVYVVIHIRQVSFQLLCVTIMLNTQCLNLFSLKCLQSFVLISLNLFFREYALQFFDLFF